MSATAEGIRMALLDLCASIPLLAALPAEGKQQIGNALLRHCQSDEHVRQVVETFQETVLEWRNPIAELVKIARATSQPDRPPDGCERCEDPAWRLQSDRPRWLPRIDFYEGEKWLRVDFCTCARGEWMRAREAERLAGGGR